MNNIGKDTINTQSNHDFNNADVNGIYPTQVYLQPARAIGVFGIDEKVHSINVNEPHLDGFKNALQAVKENSPELANDLLQHGLNANKDKVVEVSAHFMALEASRNTPKNQPTPGINNNLANSQEYNPQLKPHFDSGM